MNAITESKPRIKIITEWLRVLLGLIVFAYGVHLTIIANIGLGPWDCLGMGISYHTPLNFGLSMTLVSVCLLIIDLILKEKIGYGTIIDALVTGNLTQFFNSFDPLPYASGMAIGIVMMLIGVTLMAIGQFIYMKTAHGCGPRDSFLNGVGKRLKKLPIGLVQAIILAVVLFFGWILGGKVGIGTLINVIGTGVMMQVVFKLVHFEPRDVKHRSVIPISKILFTRHFRGTDRAAFGSGGIHRIDEYLKDRYGKPSDLHDVSEQDGMPALKKEMRLAVSNAPNTLISGHGIEKNCSVSSVARIVFYWKMQGVIKTDDTLQEIYQKAETFARWHGYNAKKGLRAVKIDDLSQDLLRAYGYKSECKGIYGWEFKKDVQPELDAGRPVILSISGGYYHNHSVVVTGYKIYDYGKPDSGKELILLNIADGWRGLPRFIDLHAFNREFPFFGISSVNTMKIL